GGMAYQRKAGVVRLRWGGRSCQGSTAREPFIRVPPTAIKYQTLFGGSVLCFCSTREHNACQYARSPDQPRRYTGMRDYPEEISAFFVEAIFISHVIYSNSLTR